MGADMMIGLPFLIIHGENYANDLYLVYPPNTPAHISPAMRGPGKKPGLVHPGGLLP